MDLRHLTLSLAALALACVERGEPVDLVGESLARAHALADSLSATLTVQDLSARGEALFFGRAGCATCHRVDDRGNRYTGPNLGLDPDCTMRRAEVTRQDASACATLTERSRLRRPELTPLAYMVESIVDPDHLTVPGYARGVMKRAEDPPIALGDEDILALATWLVYREEAPRDISISETIAPARAFIQPCRERRDTRLLGEAEPTRPTDHSGPAHPLSGRRP